MPETDKYSYPSPEERDYIGRRMGRVDGVPKSTGRARYTYDYNPKGLRMRGSRTSIQAKRKKCRA